MRGGTIILVTFSMVVHFCGALFFYAGAFGWIFGYGTVQILPQVMLGGISIMICGIVLGIYVGKSLKITYLAIISLAYLIVATSLFYYVFSMSMPYAKNQVSAFVPLIFLGNVTLGTGFLRGYSRRNKHKSQ